MPHTKDIRFLKELQDFFCEDQKASEVIIDLFKGFYICKAAQRFNEVKEKGFQPVHVLLILLIIPFLGMCSIYALYKSGYSFLTEMEKDVYYRLKNNEKIDWRKLLYSFVKRSIKIIVKQSETDSEHNSSSSPRCLIIDDTTFSKRGKKLEFIGKVFDHVQNSYVLGFKTLVAGFWDSESFLPLDFSFHHEKGKNKKRPFGLKRSELMKRYSKKRDKELPGYKREKELSTSKIKNGLLMIKRAVKNGFIADYVLVDKWFLSEMLIKEIRKIRKGIIHVIAACKMDKRRYEYQGKECTAKEILKSVKHKKKRSRKLKAFYIELEVMYKGIPLKLFFNKFSGRKNWELLVTTHTSLNFQKAIEIYSLRWTIEVFFKESKQYLNFGKSQSQDFDAQIADTTVSMIQYIMLSLQKRLTSYETIGGIFRNIQKEMMELTLAEKLWKLFLELQQELAEIFEIDFQELIQKILYNPNYEANILKTLRIWNEKSNYECFNKAA